MSMSEPRAKKRKQADDASGSSSKKHKKEKRDKKKKGRRDGEFKVVKASLMVSIPPIFANNAMGGVEEMLDSLVMRYVPALQGVVLCHANIEFLTRTGSIKYDCPFANCQVGFDATVWSPQIGKKLTGKVNLCSPDHVSVLVHQTFNVSIPRHHIPHEHWEFEPGAGEDEEGGKWIHKITGDKMGGVDGNVEFTVIGFTIANQMLSLVGSVMSDTSI